jgi:hypothetical protein
VARLQPSHLTYHEWATEPTRAVRRLHPQARSRSVRTTLTPTHLTASAGSPEWHFWQAERRRVWANLVITMNGGLRPALLASGRPQALRALRQLMRRDVDLVKAARAAEATRRRTDTANRLVREWRAGQFASTAPKPLTTQVRVVDQYRPF